jgi:hypothetical protein
MHDTAALRALSDGYDPEISQGDPTLARAEEDAAGHDQALSALGESVEPPADSYRQRQSDAQSRSNRMADQHQRTMAMEFRKIAIPLLLVMAVLLVGIGVTTLIIGGQADETTRQGNALLRHGGLFATVAFVLGGCLLLGGIVFHFEVRRHKKNTG